MTKTNWTSHAGCYEICCMGHLQINVRTSTYIGEKFYMPTKHRVVLGSIGSVIVWNEALFEEAQTVMSTELAFRLRIDPPRQAKRDHLYKRMRAYQP